MKQKSTPNEVFMHAHEAQMRSRKSVVQTMDYYLKSLLSPWLYMVSDIIFGIN